MLELAGLWLLFPSSWSLGVKPHAVHKDTVTKHFHTAFFTFRHFSDAFMQLD